ncbi:hypothetical protein P700755_003218 [Psychroflexus torquis ATCC 700755]|uniref:Secreted protein n=1 Tax=Psychroflexus torquis (strain ATCC 700755 / CIP 106069 / ACAM 623) TaxID=313595 RepID=K4IJ65_PSYTT|nr:DUF4402 domain-containing protein [Psychroflexus torquis]AFU69868.1 hypothetical protein P700755_003218 [Psychroflexus torquis ATCC 700755]
MNLLKSLILALLFLVCSTVRSQNIYITVEQNLVFGNFYLSNGTDSGTVSLSNKGEWSSSRNIHQLLSNHQPAVFNISTKSKTPVNVRVEVMTGTLSNENGYTISLNPQDSGIQFYKVQKGLPVTISRGANLEVTPKNKNYRGDYQGNISITATVHME